MEELCTKCKVAMNKNGKMDSGNSTFQEFQCPNCGSKTMKAIGIN
jgi:predicted RNA-binding Zn-ribbon protein involved in translation (DUF1610 family)